MNQSINAAVFGWLRDDHTERELAQSLGITEQALSMRLCGACKWRWREVVRIASLVGCSLDELA